MKVVIAPLFVRQYRGLSKADQRLCDGAVAALPKAFGYPHQHTGLGLRALRRGVYECRAGQAVRIGFTRHADTLLFQTVGNHDVIRTWLRHIA
jgi:mRNA-degrading endonuclease RelE of RelBE toxin-antitoxin system